MKPGQNHDRYDFYTKAINFFSGNILDLLEFINKHLRFPGFRLFHGQIIV